MITEASEGSLRVSIDLYGKEVSIAFESDFAFLAAPVAP